jgi:hypothetical protein
VVGFHPLVTFFSGFRERSGIRLPVPSRDDRFGTGTSVSLNARLLIEAMQAPCRIFASLILLQPSFIVVGGMSRRRHRPALT